MQKLLLETLATVLLIRTAAAGEHDGAGTPLSQAPDTGLGAYILHGLGHMFTGQPASTSAIAPSPTSPPHMDGPPWTVSVPSPPIAWSSDFNTEYVSHAQSCWNVYTSWYVSWYASSFTGLTTSINSTSLATYTTRSTIYPKTSISTYELCDGTPRAHYSPSTTVFNTTLTEVFSNIVTTTSPVIPDPQCRPNQDDCAVLYYGTNLTDFSGESFARVRLYGACGAPLDAGFPCLIQGGPVQLLYFPVTTNGGGLCGPDGTTIMPTAPPSPITTLGTTLYPDSAYISFQTLYAAYRPFNGPGGAAAQVGPTFSNTIIAFKSEEMSTNCYATWWNRTQTSIPGYGPGTPLDFADLNSPVLASAYECQNQCLPYSVEYENGEYTTHTISPNPCSTIFDNFNPLLAVPTRLRELVPEWNKCTFWSPRQANVIFDPPLALTEAPWEAVPTPPPGYQPSPSATPQPPVSATTQTAQQDNMPSSSTPAAQPPSNTQGGVSVPNDPPASSGQDPPATTTIIAGSRTITAIYPQGASGTAIVDDTPISVGGSAITIEGQVISMGSQGLVVGDAVSSSAHTTSSSLSRGPTSPPTQTSSPQSVQTATTSSGTRNARPLMTIVLFWTCLTTAFIRG